MSRYYTLRLKRKEFNKRGKFFSLNNNKIIIIIKKKFLFSIFDVQFIENEFNFHTHVNYDVHYLK